MSHYIVLVKQVPDVTQITDNAFDPESGTLIRSRLASVINELDTQALAFAEQMRRLEARSSGRIITLTMGPPMAEEVLRYCLSRCADEAILLTDKRLGGADTVATANPLAWAVRKIVAEMLDNSTDYYVVCGMQSVDGDTAQVPPQIAEELSMPCITYVTEAEYVNNRFQFTRIVSGGDQIVAARSLPAVVTVAKCEYPLFATFAGTRRAEKTEIINWNSDNIRATNIGVQGSKTSVIRVFPPGKSTRKCIRLKDAKSLAKMFVESLKAESSEKQTAENAKKTRYVLPHRRKSLFDRCFETTKKENEDFEILAQTLSQLGINRPDRINEYIKGKVLEISADHFHSRALDDMLNGLNLTAPSFKGEVWVIAEQNNSTLHPAAFELIGKARQLADSLETKVGVCLAGFNVEPLANRLIAAGADNIYLIEDKLLEQFDPAAYRKAVADCISTYWPQIVLFAATPLGRMLAPMVSYRLGCGLTADCTSLDIRDSSRKASIAILLQTRPALGGNVMASICTKNSRAQMATTRPGVMKPLPPDSSRKGSIIRQSVKLADEDVSVEIIETKSAAGGADFTADVVVSGGKGMQNKDNYERLVGSLCDCIRKKLDVKVERGASRAAVERGFAERAHQVGQTGTSIGPKLYVALGISGAIQHMIGVSNTETIIAVNSDPNAPIFKQCDYYMIGTVEDIVPELVQTLKTG